MDWQLLRGRWRLWRNRCPACNSDGSRCGICYRDADYFTVLPKGKLVIWERYKRELNIHRLFTQIEEGFAREAKRRQKQGRP